MISHLNGKLVEKSPTDVVIECGGVGYFVNISLHTYSSIGNNENIKLYNHLQVREDAHNLNGFFENSEREIFSLLISVSGVGATLARTLLSSMSIVQIGAAI